mmetsp:Transcript_22328/g.60337  ORF Transcript_22328/g.60337 Transcript_22328/m.60337 type:complete len:218 (-) Transcript_22328:145-798(-)
MYAQAKASRLERAKSAVKVQVIAPHSAKCMTNFLSPMRRSQCGSSRVRQSPGQGTATGHCSRLATNRHDVVWDTSGKFSQKIVDTILRARIVAVVVTSADSSGVNAFDEMPREDSCSSRRGASLVTYNATAGNARTVTMLSIKLGAAIKVKRKQAPKMAAVDAYSSMKLSASAGSLPLRSLSAAGISMSGMLNLSDITSAREGDGRHIAERGGLRVP